MFEISRLDCTINYLNIGKSAVIESEILKDGTGLNLAPRL